MEEKNNDEFLDGAWLNESKSGKAVQIDLGFCWLVGAKKQLIKYLHGESAGYRFSMIIKNSKQSEEEADRE